ncbi:MAG: hypothetical protein JSU85_01130 [Candidatus Zixiibacteriota bacterium]|nr:MAG: hypothetical protein JSU85_01130 [candidate division Zixibacteria bacterium]
MHLTYKIPEILVVPVLGKILEKAFVRATTYTTKKGKIVKRKAYTDKRIAKEFKASDKIKRPWTKYKTYKEVKEKLHEEKEKLEDDLEEIRRHKKELAEAKEKKETHTKSGIHVKDEHHIDRHHENLKEKLEHVSNKMMLHERHVELGQEAREERAKKAREKRKAEKVEKVEKKEVPKEKTSDQYFKDYYAAKTKEEKVRIGKLAREQYMKENPKASMGDFLQASKEAREKYAEVPKEKPEVKTAEVKKPDLKNWKPKIKKGDNTTHYDYSDEPRGIISMPEFKSTGFVKFTKRDLETGMNAGPLQDAVNTFLKEKQEIISSVENEHKRSEEFAKKRDGSSTVYHYIEPKIDAGYQIIDGKAYLRLNATKYYGYYKKDDPLPKKLSSKKTTYIITPNKDKVKTGQSWRDEINVQKEVYTKYSSLSDEDRDLINKINSASSYHRHNFFQKAKYDPKTNTIYAELNFRANYDAPETKISANLNVPRFLHLLAYYNSTNTRGFSSGYVIPEKNLGGSVKEQIGIHREDNRAFGERISSSYYEAYLKGLETSFGEKNAKDTLKGEYGVRIKRQNGNKMDDEEVNMLRDALEHTYTSIGSPDLLKSFAEERNLKVSFSGNKKAFLTKADGLYVPTESTIVAGSGLRNVLPHEFAHFVDDVIGTKHGQEGNGRGYYASELTNTDIGQMTAEGRQSFIKGKRTTSAYWSRSCEVFARMIEQYAALNDGNKSYYSKEAYWSEENFNKLKPKIEKVLKTYLGKSFYSLFNKKLPSILLFKVA